MAVVLLTESSLTLLQDSKYLAELYIAADVLQLLYPSISLGFFCLLTIYYYWQFGTRLPPYLMVLRGLSAKPLSCIAAAPACTFHALVLLGPSSKCPSRPSRGYLEVICQVCGEVLLLCSVHKCSTSSELVNVIFTLSVV